MTVKTAAHQTLSKREREVFQLILAGKRNKEIALLLFISVKTVSTHRARVMQKIGVTDNRGLFQYAVHLGLVDWLARTEPYSDAGGS